MKTAELACALLDYWMGRAEGRKVEIVCGYCVEPVARSAPDRRKWRRA